MSNPTFRGAKGFRNKAMYIFLLLKWNIYYRYLTTWEAKIEIKMRRLLSSIWHSRR